MRQLGFFLIWQAGEEFAQEIIEDLRRDFNIVYGESFFWSKDEVCQKLNLLYPHREFNYKSNKVKEIGADYRGVRLHGIVVRDVDPLVYEDINANYKAFKDKYRIKYNTNFLHGADNEAEALSNIECITSSSIDTKRLLKDTDSTFLHFDMKNLCLLSSSIKEIIDIQEVADILNQEEIKWVILRNWDDLDHDILSSEHGDVDILVDDLHKTVTSLNAIRATELNYRVQYRVNINSKLIPFDIRYVGDNYYHKNWEKDILESRIKYKNFYIPNKEHHFFSLLYHAIVHKHFFTDEYRTKLLTISEIEPNIHSLKSFLKKQNYKFVKPGDRSVHYRFSLSFLIFQLKKILKKNKLIRVSIEWIKR